MTTSVVVQGYERLQEANRQLAAAMQPDGALGKAVIATTERMREGVVKRAHRLTGTYAASQMTEYEGLTGRVYTAANVSPRGGIASEYGPEEEARGGSHAAYGGTVDADAIPALEEAGRIIVRSLP